MASMVTLNQRTKSGSKIVAANELTKFGLILTYTLDHVIKDDERLKGVWQ